MSKIEYVLQMQNISKEFPGVKALEDVSIDLKKGEVLSIVGENGAGKSTLIKVLCGVHRPTEGTIKMDGNIVSFSNPMEAIEAKISTIHQELSYLKDLSIAENMFIGRLPLCGGIKHVDWEKLYMMAQPYMDEVGLKYDVRTVMEKLSVGDKQLVEIANAISRDCKIIIMDEPTSSLGIEETERLMNLIKILAKKGISIIYISHRLNEVITVSDRVVCMRDGRKITELTGDEITTENMVKNMVGRELKEMYPAFSYGTDETLFEVRNLCTDYLKNISFKANKGEVLGLFGMAGSGRTEAFDTMFGVRPKKDGQVYIEGKEVEIRNPKDAIDNGMAYVTAERKQNGLVLIHSVSNNTVLTTLDRISKHGILDKKKETEIANSWIKTLGIKTLNEKVEVNNLSGGNQQKVVLAKWLETNPKVLFLNEPTRGVDVGAKKEIYAVIEQLCKQGLCIVMIASEMSEIMSVSDRIITFAEGRITKELQRDQFTQENLMIASIPGGK